MRASDAIRRFRPGVLSKHQIKQLGKAEKIEGLIEQDVGYSSFDLHLSDVGYELKAAVKALPDKDYADVIRNREYCEQELHLTAKQRLKKNSTYVFPLEERLHFVKDDCIYGQATGRSSIGRLNVLTRLITNRHPSYDEVRPEYQGDLFLEVTPITFDIEIRKGVALGQLRLFRGKPEFSEISSDKIRLFGDTMLDQDGEVIRDVERIRELRLNLGLLEVGSRPTYAFRAKQSGESQDLVVDLTLQPRSLSPEDYWDRMPEKDHYQGKDTIRIVPGCFYILRSKERFKLPDDVTVYAEAVTAALGELRIHYAGFVHPCFGASRPNGTPVIFEVCGFNINTLLQDGEKIAEIRFYRMSEPYDYRNQEEDKTKEEQSGYEPQELTLSNYFGKWEKA